MSRRNKNVLRGSHLQNNIDSIFTVVIWTSWFWLNVWGLNCIFHAYVVKINRTLFAKILHNLRQRCHCIHKRYILFLQSFLTLRRCSHVYAHVIRTRHPLPPSARGFHLHKDVCGWRMTCAHTCEHRLIRWNHGVVNILTTFMEKLSEP